MSQYTHDDLAVSLRQIESASYTKDGPLPDDVRHVLRSAAATLRQQAARVDEGMLRDVLGNVVKSMRATGRSWGPTRQAQVLDTWADEIETTIEAALSAQPAETITPAELAKRIRNGERWELADAAQPAPERQGARKLVAWMTEGGRVINAETRERVLANAELGGEYVCAAKGAEKYCIPLYHPAAPVGVPDGVWGRYASWLLDHCEGEVITEESLQSWLADMLSAAPSAPQGTQQGVG